MGLKKITREQYQILINNFYDEGWRLDQSEWHHSKFIPAETMNQQDQLFPVKCTAPPPKKRSVLLFEERLRSLGL